MKKLIAYVEVYQSISKYWKRSNNLNSILFDIGQGFSMKYKSLYLTPFQQKLLLKKLCEDNLSPLSRQRIEIMILADQGKSQTQICAEVGCCTSTARHWMHMARSGMAHLWEDHPLGRPKVITDAYLDRLKELLSQSPRDYKYPFHRWTADWLRKHLSKELGIEVSLRHIKRLLKQMGLSTLTKPSNTEDSMKQKANTSKITIRDLKSEAKSKYTGFMTIDLEKLSGDSGIHGGIYIKGFSFSATVQQYFRPFSIGRGISTLS
ncbi:helix-turn-helix domain-containing protein [Acaryochloris sp. IP29b_bin.137]|uniref:helix-turn-helix domain-containing protein n=1 Tax=Acaryochloris sp. IP29b_bin.137 TaxID=2969217 RepID=UPI00260A4100|nr:helix-turn-helix domain-containing protein [Acaryochloris sp. IP29b_bin.137]